MANNRVDIFEDDISKAIAGLRKAYEKGFSDDMTRAAEILEDEYYKFLKQGAVKGVSGAMGEAEVKVERRRKFRSIPRSIRVYVPDDTDNVGNIAFNVLNGGRRALGAASNYGLKAWPMAFPREIASGNSPMTRAGSPDLRTAFSDEPVVFVKSIDKPIAPRNFVKKIHDNAKKRMEKEGLDYISLEITEQD